MDFWVALQPVMQKKTKRGSEGHREESVLADITFI